MSNIPQTTYNINPAAGRNGLVADNALAVIRSRLAQGNVPIGKLCTVGTRGPTIPALVNPPSTYAASPGQVTVLPASITDDPLLDSEFLGIPIWDGSREPFTALDEWPDQASVPVLERGTIWVNSETATTDNADVYVRVTTVSTDVRGQWRAGAAANFVKMPTGRARWVLSTTVAGLSLLELR